MTDDRLKLALSLAAFFSIGVGAAYQVDANAPWLKLVIAGALSTAGYITGYVQTNPRLQPRTAEALLVAVKAADVAPEVKLAVAPVLAQEAIRPLKRIASLEFDPPQDGKGDAP
jgi:hypothetical protein